MNSQLESAVYTFLVLSRAFPQGSIQSEAAISTGRGGKTAHADFAIVDKLRGEIVSLIEVKGAMDPASIRNAASQLEDYRKILEKPHIPLFLFLPAHAGDAQQLQILQILQDGKTREIAPNEFPTFEALIAGDAASRQATRKVKAREVIDSFHLTCVCLAVVVFAVLLLDLFDILVLSIKQLVLGGISGAMLILPFTAKFKLLGVEFERHLPKKESASDA